METASANITAGKKEVSNTGRIASMDALRGFDMLMISGGGAFIFLLGGKTGIAFIDAVSAQFIHPEWHGFTFYDFIFPIFPVSCRYFASIQYNKWDGKGYC